MAEFLDKDIAEEAARILARGIVAAFYEFTIAHDRMTRLGLGATNGERQGMITLVALGYAAAVIGALRLFRDTDWDE